MVLEPKQTLCVGNRTRRPGNHKRRSGNHTSNVPESKKDDPEIENYFLNSKNLPGKSKRAFQNSNNEFFFTKATECWTLMPQQVDFKRET